MKLNNKGFAISTIMYMILILAVILIIAILSILSARKLVLDKLKKEVADSINVPIEAPETICKAVDTSKAGSVKRGTEYKCQVNSTTSYNFYVLSTDGDNVSLLMNGLLKDDVYFLVSQGYDEPVTKEYSWNFHAESLVEDLTSGWFYIDNLNEDFEDFQGYTINLTGKARLPRYSEISRLCPCTSSNSSEYSNDYKSSCPWWITRYSYWTLDQADLYRAWAVSNVYYTLDDFHVYQNDVNAVFDSFDHTFGIRPVITISKTRLEGYSSANDDSSTDLNPTCSANDVYTCEANSDTYLYFASAGSRSCNTMEWTLYKNGNWYSDGSTGYCYYSYELPDTLSICNGKGSVTIMPDIDTETSGGYDTSSGSCSWYVEGARDVVHGSATAWVYWTWKDSQDEYTGSEDISFTYTEGSTNTCKTINICGENYDSGGNYYTATVCGCNSGEGGC